MRKAKRKTSGLDILTEWGGRSTQQTRDLSRVKTRHLSTLRGFKANALRAAGENNAENFYVFVRRALRARFGFPEGLTKEELETKLAKVSAEIAENIRILITHNDVVVFAGWRPSGEEVQLDKERFKTVLKELEKLDKSFLTFDGRK